MIDTPRVLDAAPCASLSDYERQGGGVGLRAAIEAGPVATLAVLEASGLRGRGGAGFPTATKWSSVAAHLSDVVPASVVVNAAEGEPGTFKDRAIIRANPYRVIEGALIAAVTIGADEVVVATKASFVREVARLREAIAEIEGARWAPGITIEVVEGPDAYLFGEETALLEVARGRPPFPRIAPPWRRGLDDDSDRSSAASAEMAPFGGDDDAAPALVNNVETLANVALINALGPEWFRELGTEASPGTIVCTISGRTQRAGVAEVPMGTPLRSVIDAVGGDLIKGELTAVMSGVSNRLLPANLLDTPLTYEDMKAAGAGLGTGGFIVFDSTIDPVSIAHGVSRFLAVESCGQCTPCKQDGLAIADALDRLRTTASHDGGADSPLAVIGDRLRTIDNGARCFLATQHQQVVDSFLELFPASFGGHDGGVVDPAPPYVIAPLVDLVDGPDGVQALIDQHHVEKQPDWTFDRASSGQSPADRLAVR